MLAEKKSRLTMTYYDDFGQEVIITNEYSADRTWMEFIPQINCFFHACGFHPTEDTFVQETESSNK